MNPKERTQKRPLGELRARRKRNRPDFTTEEGIDRRWAEGRGKGEGRDYFPWFLVPEFSSKGYRTMTMSAKFLRVIHLFSTLEWLIFLLLEAAIEIVGLKEQVPLDREETRAIAEFLKTKHPNAFGTDVVMTTDFVVKVRRPDGTTIERAIAVKYSKDLRKRRVVEKLAIEQAYHLQQGHEFVIMTERSVPRELANNLTFVRAMLRPGAVDDISADTISRADTCMRPLLGKTAWGKMVVDCDAKLQLRPGTAARIARHQIATRAWAVDLTHPLLTRNPFRMISS